MGFFNDGYLELVEWVTKWTPIVVVVLLGVVLLFTLLWSSIPLMLLLILRRLGEIDKKLHRISAQTKKISKQVVKSDSSQKEKVGKGKPISEEAGD